MIKTKKEFKIHIPQNFDAKKLIESNIDFPKIEIINLDKLNYLVSLLYKKMKTKGDNTGETMLSSVILKSKIRHYKEHLSFLEATNVIIGKSPYKVGEKSFGYILSEEYYSSLKEVFIPKDVFVKTKKKTLKKGVRKSVRQKLEVQFAEPIEILKNNRKYAHLTKWLNPKLKISNVLFAYNEIKKMAGNDKYSVIREENYKLSINSIVKSDFYIKRDNFGGRIYTNITSLPSKFKHFLVYENEPLSGIDIKSSIPYFLGLIIYCLKNQNCPKNQLITEKIKGITKEYKKIKQERKKEEDPIMFPTCIQAMAESVDNAELKRFFKLILEGGIYKYYVDVLTVDEPEYLVNLKVPHKEKTIKMKYVIGEELYQKNREVFNIKASKRLFLKLMSGKELINEKYFIVFKKEFPTIYSFLNHLKNYGDASNKHKCSSQILQSIEAYFVLELITKEFVNKYNKPIFTIHDNMITTESNIYLLKEVAKDVFKKYCPFIPKFHDENYGLQHYEKVA